MSDTRPSRLDGTASVRVRDLAGMRLILPEQRHWIRRQVDRAAFRRGIVLDRVQQADGVALTKEMVRNGLGYTVLPFAAVRDEVARGGLAFRMIEHDPLVTVHAIACRRLDDPAPFVSEISGSAARGDVSAWWCAESGPAPRYPDLRRGSPKRFPIG